jgi:uncharacterized protein YigE (DUF2233 family)
MKQLLLSFLICICCKLSFGQFVEKHDMPFGDGLFDVFVIKLDTSLKNKMQIVNNATASSEKSFFQANSGTTFFAITPSMVEANCEPPGLYVTNGVENKGLNLATQGTGNFYSLQPNGVFFMDGAGSFNIATSQEYSTKNAGSKPLLAIQTGPCLIVNGNINSMFTKGSKNKNIRCGVGIFSDNTGDYAVFAKSTNSVNWYDFASLFYTKYNCKKAISTESGGSCSMHLPGIDANYSSTVVSCKYLMINF